MKVAKIFIALILSFFLVYKVFVFTSPVELAEVAMFSSPLKSEVVKSLMDYLIKRSYARDRNEIEIYYKGKRIKVKSLNQSFSKREKELIYVFSEIIEKQKNQNSK